MKKSGEIKKILNDLKEGKVDIIIGTHRLTSKDVVFKDLGLLIVDEEQKFGVGVKEKTEDPEIECRYPDYDGDSDPAYFTIFIDGSPRYVDYPYSAA